MTPAAWLYVFAAFSLATYVVLLVSDLFNERGRAGVQPLEIISSDLGRIVGLSFRGPQGRHERAMLVSLGLTIVFGVLALTTWFFTG